MIHKELEKLPDAEEMRRKLNVAGCVTDMEEIGLQDNQKKLTLQLCPYVRRRLTLLRLSKMLVSGREKGKGIKLFLKIAYLFMV